MARILIVDDNSMNRDLMRVVLHSERHVVEEADDGDIALQFDLAGFDLVITDIVMPRVSGFEVIRHAAAVRVPTIAVSGGDRLGGQDPLAVALELGATLAFRKPFLPTRLLSEVANCLGGKLPPPKIIYYGRG